jgi:hypothetical protein
MCIHRGGVHLFVSSPHLHKEMNYAKKEVQLPDPFDPQDSAGEPEVGPQSGGLISRQQALKLAGAATVGGAFGLLGSQETAHARRRRRKRQPKLGANVQHTDATVYSGLPGDHRVAQVFINPFEGSLTTATFFVNKRSDNGPGDYLVQINMALNDGNGVGTPISIDAVLASTIIPDRSVPEGISMVTARFAAPARVLTNVWYALVVSRPGSTGGLWIGRRTDNPSPDYLFISTSLSGNNFTRSVDVNDMVFSTYIL